MSKLSRPALAPASWLIAALLLVPAGCQSTSGKDAPGEAEPYIPSPDPEPESIGYFLAQFDKSLQRWTELKLGAKSDRDLRALNALDRNLARRAREREAELVQALESGPPVNRQIAAVALGFTENPANLSPLLVALSDRSGEVVQKALLGIGILGSPETPTSQITYLLRQDPDPWTRNNAAYALTAIVGAGARPADLADECRDALVDEEPGVRAQIATVMGMLGDPKSVPILSDLLYDDVNLVSSASARALAMIGRTVSEEKGTCARALVDALERVDSRRRDGVRNELILLADRNLGDDVEEWREWAYRMP